MIFPAAMIHFKDKSFVREDAKWLHFSVNTIIAMITSGLQPESLRFESFPATI
tara:strand:+ start:609 stop:767 length:159 start_codon:yes stop_codon:yes gene_type:complete